MNWRAVFRQVYQGIIRYKLYHIPFWIGYILIWYLLFARDINFWKALPTNLIYLAGYILASYLLLYGLIPHLLFKRRYLLFVVGFLLNFVVSSLILGLMLISWVEGSFLISWAEIQIAYEDPMMIWATFGSMLPTLMLVLGIGVVKRWMRIQRQNRFLVQNNLRTELELLKAQLNPHFLFNAINSIYFLIRKDPELAEDSLSRFSEMLRYQLYECDHAFVPLDQEIQYVQNYVELSKLRKGNRVSVTVEIDPQLIGLAVAPFLLIPLIENAFKHVSVSAQQQNEVQIYLTRDTTRLQVQIRNTQKPNPPDSQVADQPVGGIGLANLRRRLELVYPNTHQLSVTSDGKWFHTYLEIPITTLTSNSAYEPATELYDRG